MPTNATSYAPGDDRHLLGAGAIASLEAQLRSVVGMRYALCVANGTLALMGASMAMRLKGQEVVVPALAHAASVAGLLHLGARLRVADVEPDTLTLDVAAARRVATPKTAALLAVDLFGIPSNTTGLRELADDRGLLYLADGAQALGATCGSTHAGSGADVLVLSFTTGKVLDLGEGGAVLTNRRDIYERVVWHTQHPYRQRRDLGLHLVNPFAINMRMHPTTAHLAAKELCRMQCRVTAHLRSVARARHVIEAAGLGRCLPGNGAGIQPSYFRLPVRLRSSSADDVVAALRSEGISVSADQEPLVPFYLHPVFQSQYRRRLHLPLACRVAERARRDIATLRIRAAASKPSPFVSRFPGDCVASCTTERGTT
jgi:dTDP-4-amino-4,6-dideoxygalactose transaminase